MSESIAGTFGHGGITLTAHPSSNRVSIEVTAANAVMDWSELCAFVDQMRATK